MNIELKEITVRELTQGYQDTEENGVVGYDMKLDIRAFSDNQKREAYERQKGICVKCGNHFEINGMEADHITPWHQGGKTSSENCQMLCQDDNRRKSGK